MNYKRTLNDIIEIKRKWIMSGYPFEIIDGDALAMPKQFLKEIFKNNGENVLVFSVIGP